jgi:hypothetical protein
MHVQVWQTLEEQGIGRIIVAVVVKLRMPGEILSVKCRANQVASTDMKSCQGPAQCGKGLQGATDAEDWNVVVSSPFADASDEQPATDATTPDTTVG